MEQRVARLEADMKDVKDLLSKQMLPILTRIDARLQDLPHIEKNLTRIDERLKDLTPIETVVARIDERMKELPTGKEFGELKGRIAQLPTTLQLLGFVFGVLAIAGLAKYFAP